MAKEKEKRTARILFVEQNKNRKEISQLLGVTQKTVGDWVDKFGWEDERTARNASPTKRLQNIKEIITSLSEQRIDLMSQVKVAERAADLENVASLRQQIAAVDDSVSKWNKALMVIQNENKITLSAYLEVMERIFNALRVYDQKTFMELIDFQEQHLHYITAELG